MMIDAEAEQLLAHLYRFIDHLYAAGGGGTVILTRAQLRRFARSWLVLAIRESMYSDTEKDKGEQS